MKQNYPDYMLDDVIMRNFMMPAVMPNKQNNMDNMNQNKSFHRLLR